MAWTWDTKGTTATYEDLTNNTKIVVKGAKANASLPDPDTTNGTITLTSDMLDGKAVSISTSKIERSGDEAVAYRLVLDSSVIGTPTYSWSAPNVAANAKEAGVTVTYACEYTSNYSINGRNIAYSKTSKKTTQNIFTISGVNNQSLLGTTKGTSDQSTKIAALFPNITGTMSEKIAVTPTAAAFTNANMVINTVNKTMLPASDNAHTISIPDSGVAKEATYDYQWSFNSATAAAYKETQNRYYTQDKPNTIKYTAAKTSAIATVNGISKDFKTECEDSVLSTNGYANDEAFRTAVLAASTANGNDKNALVAAKAAYDKSLGAKTYDNLTAAQKTTILNAAKTAYFKDETVMGQVSTLIAADITMPTTASANAKLTDYSGDIVVDEDLFDNKNITLARGTSTDRTKATYNLALSSIYEKPDVDYLWSFTNNTGATYKETQKGFYDDGQSNGSLKYTATKTATLATLNGLNANFKTSVEDAQLLDDFGSMSGITADAKFIAAIQAGASTADSDALVDARAAYTKSLGTKTYDNLTTAQQATIIKAARTAYFKDSEVMEEVSDLIAGGLSFAVGGSDYDDALTVGAEALGTANLTLVRGKNLDNDATAYTFTLSDDVLNGTTNKTPTIAVGSDSYAWVVTGANAKLQKMTTSAGYTADNDARNPVIKYTKLATSTKADETLVTIGGLKNGIVADGTGSLSSFFTVNSESGIVTLNQSALGTADIKITDNDASKDWTLAFLSSIVSDTNKIFTPEYIADNSATKTDSEAATKTEGLAWDYKTGTAKLIQTLKPGYTMSHDGKTVYYNVGTVNTKAPTGEKNVTIAQLTGLATGIANIDNVLDYSFVNGSNETDPTITVGANALNNKPVTATGTGNFNLAFNEVANSAGGSVAKSSVTDAALTLPSATAKYSQTVGIGYSIDTTGKKINYNAKATESVLAQISGFADYYKTLSTEAKDKVTSSAMGVSAAAAVSYDDALKAAYDKYAAQAAGITEANKIKAAQQAYIDTEAIGGISLAGSVFKIYEEALGSTNIVLNTKGNYTVNLSGESSIKRKDDDEGALKWNVNGTNASYQGHHNAYYTVANNGKQITYTREKWDKDTPIKITGLNKNVDPDTDITATTGDTGKITLNYNALSTTPIVVTAKGDYANADLELGSDVTYKTEAAAKEAKKAGWIINGTTATYQTFTPAYYTIDNKNNKIAYHALAKEGNALITLTGVKSGLTTNADGVVTNKNINLATTTVDSASTINVVMKAGALDTKNGGKVTIKGTGDYADAKLALYTSSTSGDPDVPTASSGDEFSYSGANVVLKAGEAGYICDGSTITYSDGTNSAPTLATITGLKGGLSSFENIIGLNGTVINIGASALNRKDVSLTNGNYTLALGSDSATADITATTKIAPTYSGSNVVFEQSLDASSTAPKYSVDTTQKKIKYYTSPNTTTLATLTGVKSGIGLSSAVSIDTASSTITINEAAFDTNHSTIKTTTNGYTLALGGMSDVLSGVTPTFKYNGTGKKVELAQAAGLSGYALAPDEKSISYYAKDGRGPVLATITGLNSDVVSDATKLTSGVTLDGKKITLEGSVLGTTAVSITDPYSQNYELALNKIQYNDDGQTVKDGDTGTVNTNDSVKFDGWIVSGTTATLNDDATKAYYTLANNKVTYTAAKKGTEGVKVSGLKSGLLPDTDGNIWTDKENSLKTIDLNTTTKKITLDKNALGTSNITVSDSTYSLVLLDKTNYPTRGVDTSTTSYEWSATPAGAVTLNQVITEGYEVVSNVVQRTAAKTTTVGTLTGYNPNIKTDAEFDAADFVTEANMTATDTDDYTTVQKAAYDAYNAATSNKLTAAKNAYISTAIAETIGSYLTLGTVNDQGVFSKATASTDISTVNAYQIKNAAIFGTTDLKLTGSGGFTFDLGSMPTAVSTTKVNAWIVSGTIATLNSNCDNEYYTLSSDSKTITYNPAEKTASSVASTVLTGIKSGLKSGQWSNFITPGDSNKYTLTQAVLGTSKLTVSDGATLALGVKVTPSNISGADAYTFGADLSLSGTTATLNQYQTKGYMLNTANNEISYISADKTAKLATISNLNSDLKTTVDGFKATDFASAPTDTTATDYAEQTAAYNAYQEVITADITATAAALAAAKEAYINAAIKVSKTDGKITLSDTAIGTVTTGTKKVTLSTTEGYKLAAAKEAGDATTAYEWTVTGNNATYNHNQVAGNVTALDGKSITYSATGTTTPLAVVTGFNKALNGNATEFVKHVAVRAAAGSVSETNDPTGKIIEVDATALKDTTAVKISTNNNEYYLAGKGVTAKVTGSSGKAGWVIDTKTGTAEYVDKSTEAFYKMDDATAPQSLTYTAAVKDDGAKTIYTVSGLKKSTRFESSDIELTTGNFNGDGGTVAKAIKLSENTLGSTTTAVTLTFGESATDDQKAVRLALGNSTSDTQMTATKTGDPAWTFSGTTATLKETRPAGYELTDDNTITNIKTDQTATRATVSGIAKLDTIDASSITAEAMAEDQTDTLKAKAKAAYDANIEAGGTEATALAAAKTAYAEAKMATALTVGTTTVDTATVPAITVGKTALGTTAVSVAAGKDVNGATTSYTFVLSTNASTGEKVPVDTTAGVDWYISGTKAEYTSCVPAHYTLAENKITYTAQAKADSTATSDIVIDGLKSGATASGITLDTENTQIKLSKDVLGTGTTKISSTTNDYAAYKLNFATTDAALVKATSITPTWDQGTTTKLNISQEAQTYLLALDGKSITYSATAKDNTVATIGGLFPKPRFGDMKKYSEDGGKTITITDTQVAEAKAATVDGKDYTFTFDADYKGTITSETVESTTTYTVTARAKITGGANADKIVANGDGLEIAGGKGDDNITLGTNARTGGDWVTFAAGDGDDTVINFTTADFIKTAVAAGSITVTRPTDGDVVVDFGNGSITLKGYSKTADVHFVNNSGTDITADIATAKYTSSSTQTGRSLLYDDNYMETTPVLSSITEITADDYSVGNIEGAADLTKLTKEETPIIASSK